MSRSSLNIAVVGATGAIGREIVSVLESRDFPLERLELFASPDSVGEEVLFRGRNLIVQAVSPEAFHEIDVVIGATSPDVARDFIPLAVKAGARVIDLSPAHRLDRNVPLVVPEVNLEALGDVGGPRLVACPDSVVVPLVVVLKPLQIAAGLKRVVVSTYQSTSGNGQRGMEALSQEVLRLYRRGHVDAAEEAEDAGSGEPLDTPYAHQIAFNAIPQVGSFLPDRSTTAEQALVSESRKILAQPDLRLTATCVRVPWFACHALSVNIETERHLTADQARALLEAAPGVVVDDEPGEGSYPMPFPLAGSDEVFVGRVRQDSTVEHGLSLWIVADNLRKGAALNAVQILEALPGDPH